MRFTLTCGYLQPKLQVHEFKEQCTLPATAVCRNGACSGNVHTCVLDKVCLQLSATVCCRCVPPEAGLRAQQEGVVTQEQAMTADLGGALLHEPLQLQHHPPKPAHALQLLKLQASRRKHIPDLCFF